MKRLCRRAIAVLTVLVVVACGVPSDSEPRALDAAAAPFRSLETGSTPQPTGSARAVVYLVREGLLVTVSRRVEQVKPGPLLAALVAGPTEREQEQGLGTAVPPDVRLQGGASPGGLVGIELPAGDATTGGRTDEVLALGQLVLTLTSLPGIRGVQVFRDGESLSVPRGDGSLSSKPLARADYAELLG